MGNILIIGPAYPYRGGIAAFSERLASQFIDNGYNVDLITFTLQYPSFLFPGKSQLSSSLPQNTLKIERKLNSINPFNWIRIGNIVRKRKYDVVVFAYWMSFFAPCYGTVARRMKKTKRIALVHNMIPHEPSVIDKLFTPFFVKSMDGFVSMSESVLGDIEKFDRKRKPKLFSPHPIYDHYGLKEDRRTALHNLNLDEKYRYILFFGLVRAYKGLDLLVEAFADERLRRHNVKLIVAGEFYDDKKPYLDRISELALTDDVIICDEFVPDSEVKNYFNAADMVVQPYKTATQSGVTQIAYHFDKPMLVTKVGALEEIVPDGVVGYAVEPEPKAIADALDDFFENDRRDFFENNIKNEKKKYSWDKMVETVLKVESEIVKK